MNKGGQSRKSVIARQFVAKIAQTSGQEPLPDPHDAVLTAR
ncbi:MAG: hypothetical protein ACREB8_10045 [Pseudolabrys sp.]